MSARWLALGAAALFALAWGNFSAAERLAGESATVSQAQYLLEKGDISGATAALRAGYASEPTIENRFALAQILLASEAFDEALALSQAEGEVFLPLQIETMLRLNRFDEVEALISRNSKALGGVASFHLARAAFGRGDTAMARVLLNKALREGDQGAAQIWLFRARIALSANELADARAAMNRAAESGASEHETDLIEIETRIREGAFVSAGKMLEPARKKTAFERDPRRIVLRARLFAAQGRYDEAARILRSVEKHAGSTFDGKLLLGLILSEVGDLAQAEHFFRRASEVSPRNPQAAEALLDFLASRGSDSSDRRAPPDDALEFVVARHMLQRAARRGDWDAALLAAKKGVGVVYQSPAATVFGPKSELARRSEKEREKHDELIAAAAILVTGDKRLVRNWAERLLTRSDPPARVLAAELLIAAGGDAIAVPVLRAVLDKHYTFEAAMVSRLRIDVRAGRVGDLLDRLENETRVTDLADRAVFRMALALYSVDANARAAALLKSLPDTYSWTDQDAAFFVAATAAADEEEIIIDFVDKHVRAIAPSPQTASALLNAGLAKPAADVARASLIKDASDRATIEIYREAMNRLGRGVESERFVAELKHRSGGIYPPEVENRHKKVELSSLDHVRSAYRGDPTNGLIASRYATLLEEAGEIEEADRVKREACFWAPKLRCGGHLDAQ